MSGWSSAEGAASAPVIAAGARFSGTLAFRGTVRVDGTLIGEVIAEGALMIGEGAEVRARIEVDELVVAGRLEGDALARRRIELRASARVAGALRAPRLALADGCRLDGRCETGSADPGAPASGRRSP